MVVSGIGMDVVEFWLILLVYVEMGMFFVCDECDCIVLCVIGVFGVGVEWMEVCI